MSGGSTATRGEAVMSRSRMPACDSISRDVRRSRWSERDSFGTYKPTDVLKKGTKVRVNMEGAPVEEVMTQNGTDVVFYSGRHAHITNLVPA
jgi:hypothetical protein